jgi:hypothetical protein
MHFEIASITSLSRNDIVSLPLTGEGLGEGEKKEKYGAFRRLTNMEYIGGQEGKSGEGREKHLTKPNNCIILLIQ